MVLEAPNMTYGRDIHTQTGSQEPSMRHKIRTYETLALTIRPECTHYQWSRASGPHSMCLGWQKRAKQESEPHTDGTANARGGAVAKSAHKVTAHSMLWRVDMSKIQVA